jgi:hypothetical protein
MGLIGPGRHKLLGEACCLHGAPDALSPPRKALLRTQPFDVHLLLLDSQMQRD